MSRVPHSNQYDGGPVERPHSRHQRQYDDIPDLPGFLGGDEEETGLAKVLSLLAFAAEMGEGDRRLYRGPDGTLEEVSVSQGSSGFSIKTMTYASMEDYERKQRLWDAVMAQLDRD
jgi:hypothetical protein